MSQFIENTAEKLARRAHKLAEERGSEKIINDVAEILGASSSTTQEYFLTYIRVLRASERATGYLDRLDKTDS